MNPPVSKKILTILVIALLIANIATLAFFWLNKDHNRPAIESGGPANFIIKELKFNESQKVEYMKLVEAHQHAIRPIREDLKLEKEKFFDLLQEENITEAKKQKAVKAVSVFTEKIDLITFDHFSAVRKLCNPEQKQKFDTIIKQVLQLMSEPNRGPRPPHPPMDGNREHEMIPPPGPDEMPPPPAREQF